MTMFLITVYLIVSLETTNLHNIHYNIMALLLIPTKVSRGNIKIS